MRRISATVCAILAVATAGCTSSTLGRPVAVPADGIEPTFPAPRPPRTTPAPPPSAAPAPAPGPAPGADVLTPENGYVFIETKSGRTRCQLTAAEVGCETQFVDPPDVAGLPATGVRLSADGELSWVVGNLGAIPAVTLDYRTYRAEGWTIEAGESGTRFTNDETGRGMVVAVEGVETF
ncbi:hypothetical protein SAMN04489835_0727 [Mycolicibacterium rutilum]|uniref:Lipoprotein LpqJ n=1 Tax=Mycolicibacterium rutilum TaxID=370526 RepID=A0A1H6IWQ3_MYCRU|nr:hypothetical protein [Mycolicibacterium rutilum]SEH50992.1 hypothetical protein SAMN04489835_0727 [Mycolicibacterium rutilum]